jgi:hypothetical protein
MNPRDNYPQTREERIKEDYETMERYAPIPELDNYMDLAAELARIEDRESLTPRVNKKEKICKSE